MGHVRFQVLAVQVMPPVLQDKLVKEIVQLEGQIAQLMLIVQLVIRAIHALVLRLLLAHLIMIVHQAFVILDIVLFPEQVVLLTQIVELKPASDIVLSMVIIVAVMQIAH